MTRGIVWIVRNMHDFHVFNSERKATQWLKQNTTPPLRIERHEVK